MATGVSVYVRRPRDLGLLIRERRLLLGWSQRDLAMRSGVGRQWLVDLEKGKAAAPLHLLIQTLDALGLVIRIFDDTPARLPMSRLVDSGPEAGPGAARDRIVRWRPRVTAPFDVPARQIAAGQAEPRHRAQDQGAGLTYEPTDFESLGETITKDKLYQPEYRAVIERMVTHVIRSEGPVFDELVARRIARVHGLARATGKLLQITRDVTDPVFARSSEDNRSIVWPGADSQKLVPFRDASKEVRDHPDVPLVELASLAASFLAAGHTISKTAELMSRRMGLKRMAENTRSRFEAAAELARSLGADQ
ncbi:MULTISPECIES: DUF3320 domain-containing protein [unclassified Bradyrhizobium]|uniref:DUF3320 domain-containing protein n=1 Tax=unclassified Bradyrhizobium TaxID=2631580 RepID=UPI00247AAEC3|nr:MULTISPECIES: DUF3320 domain-containing protein [unclassified Bradyrhizobium]WGS18633.1 DUF3320 domain-containing protein [Bradyrhizobium sp. ISRA463]WGS25456.1 DUF3320 domain-containing protein [Bradyrhizobium sp. ISRA464]